MKSPDEWVPIPGALEAIARLNHAGWHTVVATNQSGLARGLFDTSALNAVHIKMNQALAKVGGRIDAVFFCPHGPSEGCRCRKPLPGLFEMIAERYGIELTDVPLVGDSLRDLEAARRSAASRIGAYWQGSAARRGTPSSRSSTGPGTHAHADLAASPST